MLSACTDPKSREEIQEILSLADRWHLRKAYILPALEAGWLAMTIPDKPRSSKQKYVTTEKGKKMIEEAR
jgi:predicted transcriptional regulator